jgi:hypothetical protein
LHYFTPYTPFGFQVLAKIPCTLIIHTQHNDNDFYYQPRQVFFPPLTVVLNDGFVEQIPSSHEAGIFGPAPNAAAKCGLKQLALTLTTGRTSTFPEFVM